MSKEDVIETLSENDGLIEETDSALKAEDLGAKHYNEYNQRKIARLNEEIEDIKQDRAQRKTFSTRIFTFMCSYLAVSMLIVFSCGYQWMLLSDTVIVTLITTTLANVIGVFTFVAKYLFHK